jgi:hypothetical protein
VQARLSDRQVDLQAVQARLSDRQVHLQAVQARLSDRQVDLQAVQARLSDRQVHLQAVQARLSDRQVDLQAVQARLSDRQVHLQAVQARLHRRLPRSSTRHARGKPVPLLCRGASEGTGWRARAERGAAMARVWLHADLSSARRAEPGTLARRAQARNSVEIDKSQHESTSPPRRAHIPSGARG